jgi:branched-chain amino acid transport system substrate-binding protein
MVKYLMAAAVGISLAAPCQAADEPVRIGLLFGFTGPIESMAPAIASSAELALRHAGESGLFLGGRTIETVRADSTCIAAAAAAKTAAERLLSADGAAALIGADCSGVATAVVNSVVVPRGVVSISPSATSPALSDIEDNGLFFRTAPSDARQGEVLADVLLRHGIRNVALTYTKNDYGKGLRILSEGGEIDYVGATGVEFSEIGEAAGTYREVVITGGTFETVRIW